jgi:hypothetical protein
VQGQTLRSDIVLVFAGHTDVASAPKVAPEADNARDLRSLLKSPEPEPLFLESVLAAKKP